MRKFGFLLAVVILGTAAFMARSDWWIVPSINRWQAGLLGNNQYFPVLTVFILALPPLLLMALVIWLWEKTRKHY